MTLALPLEIIDMILHHVSLQDQGNFSLVCKYAYDCVNHSDSIYFRCKNFWNRSKRNNKKKKLFNLLLHISDRVQNVLYFCKQYYPHLLSNIRTREMYSYFYCLCSYGHTKTAEWYQAYVGLKLLLDKLYITLCNKTCDIDLCERICRIFYKKNNVCEGSIHNKTLIRLFLKLCKNKKYDMAFRIIQQVPINDLVEYDFADIIYLFIENGPLCHEGILQTFIKIYSVRLQSTLIFTPSKTDDYAVIREMSEIICASNNVKLFKIFWEAFAEHIDHNYTYYVHGPATRIFRYACANGNIQMIRTLVNTDKCLDIPLFTKYFIWSEIFDVLPNRVDILRYLFKNIEISFEQRNRLFEFAMHKYKNKCIVKFICETFPDVLNSLSTANFNNIFIGLCRSGKLSILKYLLEVVPFQVLYQLNTHKMHIKAYVNGRANVIKFLNGNSLFTYQLSSKDMKYIRGKINKLECADKRLQWFNKLYPVNT